MPEAVSAPLNAEEAGLPGHARAEHLAGCAGCREWPRAAHQVTRRPLTLAARMPHDLPEREIGDDILLMLSRDHPATARPLRTVTALGCLPSLPPASHRKERPSCPA